MDYVTDNRIKWTKSDGTVLNHGTAAANGATYYAELPPIGLTRAIWIGLVWDAADVSAFTVESCGTPSGELSSYAAAGTGWTSQAAIIGTISSAAAASCNEWQVADATAKRWRVKRVVTTGGVCAVRSSSMGA